MLLLNPAFLFGAGFLLALLFFWQCLSSPLRRIPGPTISLFTSCILKYHEFKAERTRYVHSLHLKYGPVVRIAPNEVSFASLEGVKEIYGSGGSGYDKTEFYNLFRVYGKRTMFSTLNKEDHAKRKRILADRYANTNVMKPASLGGIKERSRRFMERCSKTVGGSVDLFICLHDYAFDCVTHHLFHPYGSDSLRIPQHEEVMKQVTFDDSLQNRLIQYYSPTLHSLTSSLLSFAYKPRETPLADSLVISAAERSDPAAFTLMSRMQDPKHTSPSSAQTSLSRLDMAAECLDHMAAGIDTTGDALCFLMWEISQPRSFHVQRRLQEELLSLPSSSDNVEVEEGEKTNNINDSAQKQNLLHKLPYLDAVVSEGLRCFPAIPMSLPRYVPAGGRTIDGYFVPEGAIVSSQAYSTHRIDETVFPDPERFNPGRWFEEKGELERKKLFFAFASGGRGCVGKHLALAEMKTLLHDVYTRFSTLPDHSMTDEDMVMSDQLISSQPRGQRCLLRFVPLQEGEMMD